MIKVAKEGHDISVDIQIYANMPAKAQGMYEMVILSTGVSAFLTFFGL